MVQQHEKISENKTAVTAAYQGGGINAVQLKNNREYPVLQLKLAERSSSQQASFIPVQRKANNTGLPDNLKSGIENLSGHSMNDVKVHYNSDKPAQLNAHAYAQGTDIHLASGQEKHLPHEAWHVVQQKQGRVKPTLQMKGKVNVNDDTGLEKEADVMGAKALQRIEIKKEKIGLHTIQRKDVIQRGGARAVANPEENIQAVGRGIQGIQGLRDDLHNNKADKCYVAVMVRYPAWKNYLKGKGGHAAIQIRVELSKNRGTKYLQAGVSATGSIQIEPIFHTVKKAEGYNIKRLEKEVDPITCANVLLGIAKEIAIAQPYQERIIVNKGKNINCSLWASKMAALADINLDTKRMSILPSPNDLQHSIDYHKNKSGITITDSTKKVDDAENPNVNVGLVPDPEFDADFNITNNLTPEKVIDIKKKIMKKKPTTIT